MEINEIIKLLAVFLGGYLVIVIMSSALVGLGAWLVFRTKTIESPMPFFHPQHKMSGKPHNYASNLFDTVEEFVDEELSPAASRLREQGNVVDMDSHKGIMDKIKGVVK